MAEACGLVSESLGRAQADVPYFALYLRERQRSRFTWPARPAGPEAAAGPALAAGEALREPRPVTVDDLAGRVGELPAGSWPRRPPRPWCCRCSGEPEPIGAFALAASAGRTPGRRLPVVPRPGRPADRGAGQRRGRVPGPAAARRGTRRAGPGQDHVLLQHQPRVPHPAHPDHGAGGGTAGPARRDEDGRPGGTRRHRP